MKFLEVSGVNDKSTTGETDEWKERVRMGDKTLQCQFDTGAYASQASHLCNSTGRITLIAYVTNSSGKRSKC